MKRTSSLANLGIACFALLLSLGLVTKAQTREKFVISAQAGGVNAVSGRAERRPFPAADWSLLSVTDDLKTGDFVKTGADGRIEMLLNPGSFLRVGENSEFELTDNSLDNLEVRLLKGTAIIEATGADGTELAINITTPHARMLIVKRGLYRVNVTPGDSTELFVRKGRVMLEDNHTKVKEGNKVVFSNTTFSVAKVEKPKKNTGDELEMWSKDRAQTVALANNKIRTRDIDHVIAGLQDYWWTSFSASSGGVWLFNPYYRCFTFMPFGFGWGSPYGSNYSRVFGCGSCSGYGPYYPGYRPYYPTGVATGSGPVNPGSGPSSGPVGTGSSPRMTPPASSDWPGRSVGKPDTNPGAVGGGGRERPMPKDQR
jgi:hypothetical protein